MTLDRIVVVIKESEMQEKMQKQNQTLDHDIMICRGIENILLKKKL